KINQVYFLGWRDDTIDEMQALKDTIEYNLGLQIDYHALVNFDTFGELINAFDGVDISVDCAIQDWRLKGPGLDRQDEDSWEMYTLPVGVHSLSGNMALWYARSRRTSDDIDRGRRQQDIARALWRKIRSDGLLQNFPLLWEEMNRIIETDINLSDALTLLPLALDTDTSDVQYFTMSKTRELQNDDFEGSFVLTPNRDALTEFIEQVVQPPGSSRLGTIAPTVAIVNASEYNSMAQVAADRLELEGFRTVIIQEPDTYKREASEVIDYTGLSKGNPVDIIVDRMSIGVENISVDPDAEREYDYKVYIGRDYINYSCTRAIQPPRAIPIETENNAPPTEPTPVPGA
ncbi:MAG: LCP family protein, partial [Aggregatilineales bacterium]